MNKPPYDPEEVKKEVIDIYKGLLEDFNRAVGTEIDVSELPLVERKISYKLLAKPSYTIPAKTRAQLILDFDNDADYITGYTIITDLSEKQILEIQYGFGYHSRRVEKGKDLLGIIKYTGEKYNVGVKQDYNPLKVIAELPEGELQKALRTLETRLRSIIRNEFKF